MVNSNFKSALGSDIFSTTTPASDLIISCSTSYYDDEAKYIIHEDYIALKGKKLNLSPDQYYKMRLDKELDDLCSSFQY